ncbi:mutator type transposase [Tanacetum coccineum]
MVKLSVDLNEPKDSSKTDKAAQNGGFTPTPSRSYIGGQVSSVNVVNIDEFCLHDLKDMVSSKSLSIGEVMKNLSKKQPSSSVEAPIVVEYAKDPFEELDDLVGEYAHIGSSFTVDDVLELGMLFETEGVGLVGKFKEVEVDADNESEEESDTEGDYTMDSDSEDLDYDPKHDDVFDDDEHIVEEQFASKEIVKGRVKKHSVETIRQLILVKNDNERVRVRCQGTIPALVPYVAYVNNTNKNVFSQTKGGPVIRENINSGKQNILGKDKIVEGKGKKMGNHVIKSLATNPDIPVRTVQDKMQKQFEVGVSKMKAFRAKRIASDIMTGSYREQYSLLKEYAQELINQIRHNCSLHYLTFTRLDISYVVQQPTLYHSSAKAEYRGVANAVAEACWLRNLLRELHTSLSSATLVYCDNVSAFYLSSNPVQHQRTKHIEIDIHFVWDLVAAGEVRVLHVPSHY